MEMLTLQESNKREVVGKASEAVLQGQVVACPTDTVYGLLADATNEEAVERIFQVKGRKEHKPLPVFVSSIAMAKEYATINERQERFLAEVWPGKVTAVLKSKGALPRELGAAETVGLRMPDYELILAILEAVKRPLTGTSANVSGMPSAISGQEVKEQFQDRQAQPNLLVDAGELPPSKSSRVVDITTPEHTIIRA